MKSQVTERSPNLTSHEPVIRGFIERKGLANTNELVLIQPPLVPKEAFDPKTASTGGYFNYPPVGLLYIAAAAKKINPDIDVALVDLNHELLSSSFEANFNYDSWKDIVRDAINKRKSPLIGLTYMFGSTKVCFKEVSNFIRSEFPHLTVLTGGVQATYDYKEILRDGLCDVVFRRESEVSFGNFLLSCASNDHTLIPNGAALLHEGRVYEFGEPAADVPMDWDITQAYDLIDITRYNQVGSLGPFSRYVGSDKPFATVLSNRGCRARCTFCTVRNFNGFGIRQRSIQNVIDEIKYLYDKKGIRNLDWLDDDLLWDPKRSVALFKGIAEQVPGLEWTAQNGLIAVAIEDEVMEWMVRSGLKAFKIGIESGNDEMLHVIKKPTTKPKLRLKRKLFAKYPEVLVSSNFIIGFPNETFAQMMDSFDFACELQYDWSSFFICQPLKGTDMFSVFQSLGDDRTQDEGYSKLLNPARSSERGEFGYRFGGKENLVHVGWDVFSLPDVIVPTMEQQKEIWFSFNFVCNFLRNHNFKNPSNPDKMVRWLESIHNGYPYDASMAATLVHACKLANNEAKADHYRDRFMELVISSAYWKGRVEQFPEMLALADVATRPSWFSGEMPTSLDRDISSFRPQQSRIQA